MKAAKYNQGGQADLYKMIESYMNGGKVNRYEHGGLHGDEPRREPEIHIERRDIVQGAKGVEGRYDRNGKLTKSPIGEYSEMEDIFYVDGAPVDEQTAMRAYSQKAASGTGDDFNEFVRKYLLAEDPNEGGSQGSTRRGQVRALKSDKEAAGSTGLLRALESYRG